VPVVPDTDLSRHGRQEQHLGARLCRPEWESCIVNGSFRTIACDQRSVIGKSNDGAEPQHSCHRTLDILARLLVYDSKNARQRLSLGFRRAPTGQVLRYRVQECDHALDIGSDDGIANTG